MTQYVAVKFRQQDTRTYTYHNEGKPVAAGDRVMVDTRDGYQIVDVASVTDEKPPFATKAILGLAPKPKPQEAAE